MLLEVLDDRFMVIIVFAKCKKVHWNVHFFIMIIIARKTSNSLECAFSFFGGNVLGFAIHKLDWHHN